MFKTPFCAENVVPSPRATFLDLPGRVVVYEALVDGTRFIEHCLVATARSRDKHEFWNKARCDPQMWARGGFKHGKWMLVVRWLGPQSLKILDRRCTLIDVVECNGRWFLSII